MQALQASKNGIAHVCVVVGNPMTARSTHRHLKAKYLIPLVPSSAPSLVTIYDFSLPTNCSPKQILVRNYLRPSNANHFKVVKKMVIAQCRPLQSRVRVPTGM